MKKQPAQSGFRVPPIVIEQQKILIVDDRKENLVALRQALHGVDAEIVEATSGNEALAATLDNHFAVAILDVMMPGMDGYELAEHLRGDEKTRIIPIMFLTASFEDEQHEFRGYEAGAVDYMMKPFAPEILRGKVSVFLEMDRYRLELQNHRDHLEKLVLEKTKTLNERVKEVECLYAISNLVSEPCASLDEAFETAVDLIPSGWLHQDVARARIVFEGREYRGDDFRETAWKQSADIVISGETYGRVEVVYLEERPEEDEGQFLREEENLLIDIARQLGVLIQRERAFHALSDSEARYRTIFDGSAEGILVADVETKKFIYANPTICRLLGYADKELKQLGVMGIHPREALEYVIADFETQAREGFSDSIHRPLLHKDGTVSNADVSTSPAIIDGRECLVGFFTDLTAREELEDQLRQAQKMEAVGQLAGGIAHDFNNLLTVILGHCDMMLPRLNEDNPLWTGLHQIRKSGEKAAALTRQLLAFSRTQVLETQVLDLNDRITHLGEMLPQLLRENIELRTDLAPVLGRVKVDPNQLEQVLINLVVNARDAMPEGGKLTFESADVELGQDYADTHMDVIPGPYVMIAVSDTGIGMDEKTRARIFEPFFTTKGMGAGTGLGLSTAYGIVRQSGGYIWCYSEPGTGTTFRIYLPRVDEEISPLLPAVDIPVVPAGTETVLVVEDEKSVRELIGLKLDKLGYTTVLTGSAEEALTFWQEHGEEVDMLLTDVIMPGMSGIVLAEQMKAARPDLNVLFMSGYARDSIGYEPRSSEDLFFLQKPFTLHALAVKIREVLGAG